MYQELAGNPAKSIGDVLFRLPTVSALSAIEAAVLFDEQLNVTTVAGFATAIVGVALVTRAPSRPPND